MDHLSLPSFNHEFTRFLKKYDPWSIVIHKHIPIYSTNLEKYHKSQHPTQKIPVFHVPKEITDHKCFRDDNSWVFKRSFLDWSVAQEFI